MQITKLGKLHFSAIADIFVGHGKTLQRQFQPQTNGKVMRDTFQTSHSNKQWTIDSSWSGVLPVLCKN
jgi:hypothetical protein